MRTTLTACLAIAVLAALGLAAGCRCGGGGVGEPCDNNDQCDPGLYCEPGSLTCAPVLDSGVGPGDGGGSDGGNCRDEDGDGVTTCAGDCDDADPFTYPGAPEVCGDGVDNSCAGGTPDAGCGGIGTFVAPPPVGDPANPGTQSAPVESIAHGIMNAMTIGSGVDVYVAAGRYAEAVTMVDGISLLGGYESTAWTRDPAANVTTIANTTAAGVQVPGGVGAATEISGFSIEGLMGGASAVEIETGSSVVVRANVINSPVTGGLSIGVDINNAGAPNGGTPSVERNTIIMGMGGSGWPNGSAGVRIDSTAALIAGNAVTLAPATPLVWGIASWSTVPGLEIRGNVIRPPATGGGIGPADYMAGIEAAGDGALIDSNDVAVGSCLNACSGIALEIQGGAVVINNISFGGTSTGMNGSSAGLRITYENPVGFIPDVLVHSNFLSGDATGNVASTSAGIYLSNFTPTSPIVVGRFINNIVYSGRAPNRFCVAENDVGIDPELLEGNDLVLETSGSSNPISGLYRDEGMTTLATAAAVDGLPEFGSVPHLDVDPQITSPIVGGDFHLMSGSPCIDVGSSAEVPPLDYEADPRPSPGTVPDIGPDET